MGLYDPLLEPASTIAPGSIQTKQVVTEQIEINENTVDNVSHEYTDKSITTVPSSKALFEAYHILNDYITSIDPHHVLYTDNTVITLPLLPEAFKLPDWDVYFNWTMDDGKMIYTSNNISGNYIKVIPEILTHPGYYFFVIDVDRLDSGHIAVMDTITDNKDYLLSTISDTGIYYVEAYVNNDSSVTYDGQYAPTATDAHTIIFEARDVAYGQSIRINSIGVYRITDRVRHYLTYYLQNNDNLEAFKKEITTIVTELENDLAKYERVVDRVDKDFTLHLNDANAHSELLTLESLGAAARVHSHKYSDNQLIGVAPEIHTHEPSECGAAREEHDHDDLYYTKEETYGKIVEIVGELDTTSGAVLTHINDVANLGYVKKGNPHGTTYSEVGAAPKDHNHDGVYVQPKDIDQLVSDSITEINNSFAVSFDAHLKANNPHGITPEKIDAAPRLHEHEEYISDEEAKNIIFSTVQEIVGELNTEGGGSGTIAPMSILQYTYGKYPDGDVKPSSILTRPVTPVIFPYIYHNNNCYYDYHSGIARSNSPAYSSNCQVQRAFNQSTTGAAFSTNPTEAKPVLVEYEFHSRRRIIGYTLTTGSNISVQNKNLELVSTYKIYVDGEYIHNNTASTKSSATGLTSFTFRYPQIVTVSSKVVDGVAESDPRFKLTSNDVILGDFVEHRVTTVVTDGATTSNTYYYKVTDISKLNSTAGYTAVENTLVPTTTNWNCKTISIHVTGTTDSAGTNSGFAIKFIPLFDDVDENCVATRPGLTYTYRSRRITTESGAKLDLSDYLAAGSTPLYLFLRTTSKTLENNTQDQQVNKLVVSEFPYEYGYHREGIPLFMSQYASSNTTTKFGTLSASVASSNSIAAYNIYNANIGSSYMSAAGTSSIKFTHTIPDTAIPKITVKSTMDEDENGNTVLIDGRFNLTTAQVRLGDYVLNEITTTNEDNTTTTEYAMYEVIDLSNLTNSDGYGTVDSFDQLPEVNINNCQLYFGSDLFTNNCVPSSIKIEATIKELSTVTLPIKMKVLDKKTNKLVDEVRSIETNVATYTDVVLLDFNGYLPPSSNGPVWFTPNIAGAVGITKLVLTVSNETTKRVGVTKFVPYLETKFYNIGTGSSEGDSNDFPLGKLTLTNGKYYHSGNVLGTDVTIPLINLGSTSNGVTTYSVYNYFGSNKIECTIIDYLGNNEYKTVVDVVDTSITNDRIVVRVASTPTGYHCLKIKRLW